MKGTMAAPSSHGRYHNSSAAADAAFLETMSSSAAANTISLSNGNNAEHTSEQHSNITRIHRGNLLRLETENLLERVKVADNSKWLASAAEFREFVASQVGQVSLKNLKMDKNSPFAAAKSTVVDYRQGQLATREASLVGLTTLSGNANVLPTLNLHVYIPAKVWAEKDHLKSRYFHKRNLVVWAVARHLMQKSLKERIAKVCYQNEHGDARRPLLVVFPKSSGKLKFRLCLQFGAQSMDWLPQPLRLVPNRCNLPQPAKTSLAYNQSILSDCYLQSMDQELDNRNDDEHYAQWEPTVVLAKIWSLQRGIPLSVTVLGTLVIYLYRSKKASPRMDPVQTLTVLWKLLAQTDWLGDGKNDNKATAGQSSAEGRNRIAPSQIPFDQTTSDREVLVLPLAGRSAGQTVAASTLGNLYARLTRESPLTPDDPSTIVQLYAKNYALAPVLLTSDLAYNVLGHVSPSSMRRIQEQATRSLQVLHSRQAFHHLFMSTARFWDGYDAYLPIPLDAIDWERAVDAEDGGGADLGRVETVTRKILDMLRRACGDRIHAVHCLSVGNGRVMAKYSQDRNDSNDIPTRDLVPGQRNKALPSLAGPTAGRTDCIVIGLTLNPDTCWRVVDRGPPADDIPASKVFTSLWGRKAELRRFQDGAIVHAVVWDGDLDASDNGADDAHPYIRFRNDDKVQGGTVERIVRHILQTHWLRKEFQTKTPIEFTLRSMQSLVDTVILPEPKSDSVLFNPLAAHRNVMKAFDLLAEFLRKNSAMTLTVAGVKELQSRLGIPLPIDGVEPLSAALRYTELFPPVPHPFLGSKLPPDAKKVSGVVAFKPIELQVRFGLSSKWPTDVKAIGAAKTAMLIKLVEGIESLKSQGQREAQAFDGPVTVSPSHADIGFMGYVFRLYVRADPELRLLRGLATPTEEALLLSRQLHHRHVVEPMHHSLVHSVFTSHPSSSVATRIAKRWVASHFLSDLVPSEAIELLISAVYTDDKSPLNAPGTAVAGFLRFLKLVSTHDWAMEPLIVDPKSALNGDDVSEAIAQFDQIRGKVFCGGPAMFVVAPYDRLSTESDDLGAFHSKRNESSWSPSFTAAAPESVVLVRLTKLASRTLDFLQSLQMAFQTQWSGAFQESTTSFSSYSALLRVDSDLLLDPECSSTGATALEICMSKKGVPESSYSRSMRKLTQGPKELRKAAYRNLMDTGSATGDMLLEWNPVESAVAKLRDRLGTSALFFYNGLCPEVIGILWRPAFSPKPFSALSSEFAQPVQEDGWKADSLVTINTNDLMREVAQVTMDVVVGTKLFDTGGISRSESTRKRKVASIASSSEDDG